jgi:hypothetical protein
VVVVARAEMALQYLEARKAVAVVAVETAFTLLAVAVPLAPLVEALTVVV